MKSNLSKLAAASAIAAAGFASQPAFAADANNFEFRQVGGSDYTGDLQIKFRGFTAECDNRAGLNGVGNNCFGDDTANSNGAQVVPFGGGPGNTPGNAGAVLNETTFGWGTVSNIQTDIGDNLWLPGDNTQELIFFMYGIADERLFFNGGGFDIFNAGCVGGPACDGKIHIDFYVVDAGDVPSFGAIPALDRYANGADAGANNAAETAADFSSLAGVTDILSSDLLFAMEFAPRGVVTDPTATLVQATDGATLPTTGEGNFLSDCTAGPACTGVNNVQFDTDGQENGTDFFGQFTLTTAPGSVAAQGWGGDINDPVRGGTTIPVPVPSALLLFGAGLAGLGGAARFSRKRKSA